MKRALLLLGLVVATSKSLPAAEFVVRPGGENKVVFVSKATLEEFEGKTNQIEGKIVADPSALGGSINVHLEVDLASLDTGIGMRNRHMRENHLETAKYPKAIFDGAVIVAPATVALKPGEATAFEAEGTFTLHGVPRPLRVKIEATYKPSATGARIEFTAQFQVTLSDFGISRPQFLFLKLAESQDVRVRAVAVAAP